MEFKTKQFFNLLFDEKDHICYGSLYNTRIKNFPDYISEFFVINPIHPRIDYGFEAKESYNEYKPRRADLNVTGYRNFMFEFDSIGLHYQLEIMKKCGIPWSTIVYSGNKSYHGILSLEEGLEGCHTQEGVNRYKNIWKRLEAKIELKANEMGFKNVIDQSSKNPSRFSRFPSYVRGNTAQDIVHLGARLSIGAFELLLSKCPILLEKDIKVKKELDRQASSEVEFWSMASEGLKNKLKYVNWGATDGLYPIIYKLTLWAIDETGIDKDSFLNLYHKYTVPQLLQSGYPNHKLDTAINDAYRSKRQ